MFIVLQQTDYGWEHCEIDGEILHETNKDAERALKDIAVEQSARESGFVPLEIAELNFCNKPKYQELAELEIPVGDPKWQTDPSLPTQTKKGTEAKAKLAAANAAELENAVRCKKENVENPKATDARHKFLVRVIGAWFGHSVVWATALVLIVYILAVLRK